MSSALKPALSQSGPQNPPASPQISKSMHPQPSPPTYGQPSHVPQNLVSNPHSVANSTNAHSNPHQGNFYLNVPNAPQHFGSGNAGPPAIPISNHPVASAGQITSGSQAYSPVKSSSYTGSYQPNLAHAPNVLPPVSQVLHATQQQSSSSDGSEKPQANGTPEVKSPVKVDLQHNHVTAAKPPVIPAPVPEKPVVAQEKPKPPTPSVTITPEPKTTVENKTAESSTISVVSSSAQTVTSSSNAVASSNRTSPSATTTVSNNSVSPIPAQETPKAESSPAAQQKPEPPIITSSAKSKEQQAPPQPQQHKSTTLKLATTPRTPARKPKTKVEGESVKSTKGDAKGGIVQKSPVTQKRLRVQTQPYQSPLPELEIISKMTSSTTPKNRTSDDKLIIFYKNEFLAVRNLEGGFYVCQAIQNIYKSSPKIKIRWLSQDKNDKAGEIYTPDFYDHTDLDCILTNLNLIRMEKGKFKLPPSEKERTDSILKRAIAVEKGESTPSLTEEHPDGLDLSLYKEESQLKRKRGRKRKAESGLRSDSKSNSTKKSPDQNKVPKVAKSIKTKMSKKPKTKAIVKKAPVQAKSSVASARSERASSRHKGSETVTTAKAVSVVDQKKAKVLAKVARKNAVTAKKTPPPVLKASKKSAPQKVQKAPPAKVSLPTRKTKRSSKK